MAIWKVAERKFDDLLDQILYNRGVISLKSNKAKAGFLDPDFSELHDPFLMKNIEEATERIAKAKKIGEVVGVFADYDADGIPGAALLYRALSKIGIKTHVYIPSREGGYGLSNEGIEYLRSKKCSLIITVDLGIRNFAEALYCKTTGIDLIITDHHTPEDAASAKGGAGAPASTKSGMRSKIPEALLVINPKVKGNKYPFPDLCGAGVAYKLIQGLSRTFPKELDEKFLKWNLDLVAISTISDVVTLLGENRTLASFGLKVLKKTKNIGLKALYQVAKLDPENITAYSVGFQIAPRINAPGRMDHATKSFELLVTEEAEEADMLAKWLEEKNHDRQLAMEETEIEATAKIIKEKLLDNKIIVVSGNWIKGVIGPVASRLVDKFTRPVIIFAKDGDFYSGSGRSIHDIDILKLVEKSEKYLEKFGGHKGACGLTVSKSKFANFLNSIVKTANATIKEEELQKTIKIDAVGELSDLSMNLYENIKRLEPYGMGNPKPVFQISSLEVIDKRIVGADEKHLSISFEKDNNRIKAIFFSGNLREEKLTLHTLYDAVFSLDLDTWQGRNELKLNIVDMKVSK